MVAAGSPAHEHLVGRRVLILPEGAQGTWGTETVVTAAHVLPVSDDGDPVQQSMPAINPATAYLLLDRFADLHPGDWVVQDLGNSAVGRNVIALARWRGLRTLSIVRSESAASALRANGGDVVLADGDDLPARINDAVDGRTARLGLTGGGAVSAVTAAVEDGRSVVAYAAVTGRPPVLPLGDPIFRELSLHGPGPGRSERPLGKGPFRDGLRIVAERVRPYGAIAVHVRPVAAVLVSR